MNPADSREITVSRLRKPYPDEHPPFESYNTTIDAYLADIAANPNAEPSHYITKASFDLRKSHLVCINTATNGFTIWTVAALAEISTEHMLLLHTNPTWKPLSIHPTYEAASRDMQTRKPPRRRANHHPANGTSPTPSVLPTEPHSPDNNNPPQTQEQT